jgi:hypothetical protein
MNLLYMSGKELYESVGRLDLRRVTQLLETGADPNYVRQDTFYDGSKWCKWYNHDGSEKPDTDPNQPTTPLRLCVFKYSDCLLSEVDRLTLIQIAERLIMYGANKHDARELFVSRYGEVNTVCILYQLLS